MLYPLSRCARPSARLDETALRIPPQTPKDIAHDFTVNRKPAMITSHTGALREGRGGQQSSPFDDQITTIAYPRDLVKSVSTTSFTLPPLPSTDPEIKL